MTINYKDDIFPPPPPTLPLSRSDQLLKLNEPLQALHRTVTSRYTSECARPPPRCQYLFADGRTHTFEWACQRGFVCMGPYVSFACCVGSGLKGAR